MQLTVQVTGIERIRADFARIAGAPERALDVAAVQVEDYISGEVGRHAKTGALERSLGKRRIPGGWEIGHDSRIAPYAKWVHDGARPHVIMARNKKALRYARNGVFWFWFGPKPKEEQARIRAWVRRKSGPTARVMFRWPKHPGTKADPWMKRAAALAPTLFHAALQAQLASAQRR